MPGIPGSSEAKEERHYETIEEHIVETKRDHDEEEKKSVRIWKWMENSMFRITYNLATDKNEVANRAFTRGLREVRNGNRGNIQEAAGMVDSFLEALGSIYKEAEGVDEFYNEFSDYKAELSKDHGELKDNPDRFPIKRSELSEVKTTFTHHGFLGGWIYRVVIAIGMNDSQFTNEYDEEKLNSVKEDLEVTIKDARVHMENRIKVFIGKNMGTWLKEGISKQSYESLEEVVEKMNTDNKEEVQEMLRAIDKFERADEEETGNVSST